MTSEHLSQRSPWQSDALEGATRAEDAFHRIMAKHLEDTPFVLRRKPKCLSKIYGDHGIPDFSIQNPKTNRIVFVEVKRQKAGGNAHERACKYMMPGILASMREVGGHLPDVIPMGWVFTGGMAHDDRYVREVMHWFKDIKS